MNRSENATNGPPAIASADKPVLLIVDDEPGPRESLRIVFKDRYHCVVVASGREGIAYAQTHPVDVAVLDIKMPDLSGIEVLRELKRLDPNTECIMLTGYETLETARAAVRWGAADYLNKPFDVFSLRDQLDKCVARRRQRQATELALAGLKASNEQLARELAQSNRAVTAGLLSAGVVHELNSPLSIISGYTELLSRDLEALGSGELRAAAGIQERLRDIQHEIDRCRAISRRFLGFARARQVAPEIVAAATLLEDTVSLLQVHPATRQVAIQMRVDTPGLKLLVWPAEVLQSLLNLAVNGLQAMNGTGQLTLSAAAANEPPPQPAFRSASFDPKQPLARLSVADTGPGIPAERLARLFEPYFTTKPEGTGMGLALVARIVEAHRGLIAVQSEPGRGATFHLYLPRSTG